MPDPPEWMTSDRATQLWNQYGPTLNKLGLLETLDAVGFSMLCESIDAYILASDQLSADDLVLTVGEFGAQQQNPLVAIVRQQSKAVRELLSEFGMTPTGRIRLTGSTSAEPVETQALDPLEELARRMGASIADPIKPVTPAKRKRAAGKRTRKKKT